MNEKERIMPKIDGGLRKALIIIIALVMATALLGLIGCKVETPDEASASAQDKIDEAYDVDADTLGMNEEEYAAYKKKIDEANSRSAADSEGSIQDQYMTDAIPEGMPTPFDWQNSSINKNIAYTCTLYIECSTILNNMGSFNQSKTSVLPSNGVIYERRSVVFYEGESVSDVLIRETQLNRIHMEYVMTPGFNTNYIRGINNIYENDCGELSGWMYNVNGWYPNYGCSRYKLQDGDSIEWRYTCDLGRDLGTYWVK